MKRREGFISNSSSTSFIISVPSTDSECPCCKRGNKWMLQAIAKYITTITDKGNKVHSMTTGEQVEEYFKNQLLEHMGSKKYAEEQLKEIVELEKDPKAFENYKRFSKCLERARHNITIAKESSIEKEINEYLTCEDTLKNRKETIQSHIDNYENKLNELKSIVRKVRKAVKSNNTVYAFTIDNWASDTEACLKKMLNDKEIECLWSHST